MLTKYPLAKIDENQEILKKENFTYANIFIVSNTPDCYNNVNVSGIVLFPFDRMLVLVRVVETGPCLLNDRK